MQKKDPPNLDATAIPSGNSLSIEFDLLNPSDEIEVELLTTGRTLELTAEARIKNIKSIEILDENHAKSNWDNLSFGTYVTGLFGILFFAAGISILLEIPRKKLEKALLSNRTSRMLNSPSTEQALDILATDYSFFTNDRKKRAKEEILRQDFPLDEGGKDHLASVLAVEIENEDSLAPAIVVFIFSGVALWYVASKFFA